MIKVLLSSQAYQSADLRFVDQLIRSLAEPPEGIQLGYNFTQCSCIDVGLSIAATDFLKTDFDYLLSIDYDILFNPHNDPNYKYGSEIKRIVDSCREKGGDLIGGPYLKRGRQDQLCAVPLEQSEILIGPGGGLTEVRYVPTGFTCISRNLLADMANTLPLVWYDENIQIYPFFQPMIYDNKGRNEYLTIDFAFSQRARDLGYKVWLDTRIILGHIGSQVFAVRR